MLQLSIQGANLKPTKEHFQNLGRAALLIGWLVFCIYFFNQIGKSSHAHLMKARSVGRMGLLPPSHERKDKLPERKMNHASK
ncbi:hypothetical protein EBR03_07360 [bacterium]|nr:hypothetical protein [bacterium]